MSKKLIFGTFSGLGLIGAIVTPIAIVYSNNKKDDEKKPQENEEELNSKEIVTKYIDFLSKFYDTKAKALDIGLNYYNGVTNATEYSNLKLKRSLKLAISESGNIANLLGLEKIILKPKKLVNSSGVEHDISTGGEFNEDISSPILLKLEISTTDANSYSQETEFYIKATSSANVSKRSMVKNYIENISTYFVRQEKPLDIGLSITNGVDNASSYTTKELSISVKKLLNDSGRVSTTEEYDDITLKLKKLGGPSNEYNLKASGDNNKDISSSILLTATISTKYYGSYFEDVSFYIKATSATNLFKVNNSFIHTYRSSLVKYGSKANALNIGLSHIGGVNAVESWSTRQLKFSIKSALKAASNLPLKIDLIPREILDDNDGVIPLKYLDEKNTQSLSKPIQLVLRISTTDYDSAFQDTSIYVKAI